MIDRQVAVGAAILTGEIIPLENQISTRLLRVDPTHWETNVVQKANDLSRQDLSLILQYQYECPATGTDVERFVRCVENEDALVKSDRRRHDRSNRIYLVGVVAK